MLTDKESKIVQDIISGRMKRRKFLAIICMAIILLVNLVGSYCMKNKMLKSFEQTYKNVDAALASIKAETKLEKDLKSILAKRDKEFHKLNADLIITNINWRLFLFAAVFLLMVVSFLASIYAERIIKKLQEEKQAGNKHD